MLTFARIDVSFCIFLGGVPLFMDGSMDLGCRSPVTFEDAGGVSRKGCRYLKETTEQHLALS